jgi:hypothetical protein
MTDVGGIGMFIACCIEFETVNGIEGEILVWLGEDGGFSLDWEPEC